MRTTRWFTVLGILITVVMPSLAQSSSPPAPTSSSFLTNGEFWKLGAQALGVLIGTVASLLKLRSLISNSRAVLKADIELFKKLEPNDPGYDTMSKYIGNSIKKTYSQEPSGKWIDDKKEFIIGCIFTIGFSLWTAYLLRGGFTWWSLLTGYFAFAGLGFIVSSFNKKTVPTKQDQTPAGNAIVSKEHAKPVEATQP